MVIKYLAKKKLVINKRFMMNKRIVYRELHQRIKAVIVHNKLKTHPEDNTCLGCTLLDDRGLSITNYFDALLEGHCIIRFVNKVKK